MKKIDRNQRIVATIVSCNYSAFNSEGIVECTLSVKYRLRHIVIKETTITAIASSVEKVSDFNPIFGKQLARAKAEKKVYEYIKSCASNDICKSAYTDSFDNIEETTAIRIALNTIDFANSMIKHQRNYIHKLIRNRFPNE